MLADHGQRICGSQRNRAGQSLEATALVSDELAVILPIDIDDLAPLEVRGGEEVHIDAKRLLANLNKTDLFGREFVVDPLLLDESRSVIADVFLKILLNFAGQL